MPAQDGRGLGNVVVHAAGAAGDDALIDHDLSVHELFRQIQPHLAAELRVAAPLRLPQEVGRIFLQHADGVRLGRVERQRRHRLHLAEVDGDHAVIPRALARLQAAVRLRPAMRGEIFFHRAVRHPDGTETCGLRRHHVDADAVVHRQARNAGAGEFEHLVLDEPVLVHRAAQRERHVVRADAARGRALQPDEHDLRLRDVIRIAQKLAHQLRAALAHAHRAERAVARVAVRAEDHAAAARHHLARVLVDDRLIRRYIDAAVFPGGG